MNNVNTGDINVLPEGCLANILSLTCPTDVGKQSAVSSTFRSAAESDKVWEKFLPSDYRSIISESCDPSLITRCSSKKELYLSLSHTPILIDGGKKSFWLDKRSGKKCFMLSARDLSISWGDNPRYWQWISYPGTRFDEVAVLDNVWWLDICGKIGTDKLSPKTQYTCYFVFRRTSNFFGFHNRAVDVGVGLVGSELGTKSVYLGQVNVESNEPRMREDGWFEIELGNFFNQDSECGELAMSIKEVRLLYWKGGLFVQGIELRPTENH